MKYKVFSCRDNTELPAQFSCSRGIRTKTRVCIFTSSFDSVQIHTLDFSIIPLEQKKQCRYLQYGCHHFFFLSCRCHSFFFVFFVSRNHSLFSPCWIGESKFQSWTSICLLGSIRAIFSSLLLTHVLTKKAFKHIILRPLSKVDHKKLSLCVLIVILLLFLLSNYYYIALYLILLILL